MLVLLWLLETRIRRGVGTDIVYMLMDHCLNNEKNGETIHAHMFCEFANALRFVMPRPNHGISQIHWSWPEGLRSRKIVSSGDVVIGTSTRLFLVRRVGKTSRHTRVQQGSVEKTGSERYPSIIGLLDSSAHSVRFQFIIADSSKLHRRRSEIRRIQKHQETSSMNWKMRDFIAVHPLCIHNKRRTVAKQNAANLGN